MDSALSWASDAVFELNERNEEICHYLQQSEAAAYNEITPEEAWLSNLMKQWTQQFINIRVKGTPLTITDTPHVENEEQKEEIIASHNVPKKPAVVTPRDQILMCLLQRIWDEYLPVWLRKERSLKKGRIKSSITPHAVNIGAEVFELLKPRQFLPPLNDPFPSRVSTAQSNRYSSAVSRKSNVSRLPPICTNYASDRIVSAGDNSMLSIDGCKIIPKKRRLKKRQSEGDFSDFELPLLIQELDITEDLAQRNQRF